MKFLINSNAQKSLQLFEIRTKFVKIDKFLNHVFKTSKKTLSYSRTYCKIYKIANIGNIGSIQGGSFAKPGDLLWQYQVNFEYPP